jgi:hypothetical protein
MKLIITHDDGTVIEVIEKVEQYDLYKVLGRNDLMNEVVMAINRGKRQAAPTQTPEVPKVQSEGARPKPPRKPIKHITGSTTRKADEEKMKADKARKDSEEGYAMLADRLMNPQPQAEKILERHPDMVVERSNGGEMTLERALTIIQEECPNKNAHRYAAKVVAGRSLDKYNDVKAVFENIRMWRGANAKVVKDFIKRYLDDFKD